MRFVFAKVSQILMMVSAFERGAAGGAAIGFADTVMLPDHGGAHCLSQAMRERNLFLSGHMSSLLSTVKEFLL